MGDWWDGRYPRTRSRPSSRGAVYWGRYRHYDWDITQKPPRTVWTDVLHNAWDAHMSTPYARHVDEPLEYMDSMTVDQARKTRVLVCVHCAVNTSLCEGMAVL